MYLQFSHKIVKCVFRRKLKGKERVFLKFWKLKVCNRLFRRHTTKLLFLRKKNEMDKAFLRVMK